MEDLSAGRTDPDRDGGRRIRVVVRCPSVEPGLGGSAVRGLPGAWVLCDPGGGALTLRRMDGDSMSEAAAGPARGPAMARTAAAVLAGEARELMSAACARMRGLGLDEEGVVLEALRTLAEEVHSS